MSPAEPKKPAFQRAFLLTTTSSVIIPLAGLLTAPLLARALDADGRGELAAIVAPATLMLGVATLGLPEALTYHLARNPTNFRRAATLSSVLCILLGLAYTGVIWLFLPFFSGGNAVLGSYILLATLVSVPALLVNVARGAATGLQLWGSIAIEKVALGLLRLTALLALFVGGYLTVNSAVVVTILTPLVSGVTLIFAFLHWRSTRPKVDHQHQGEYSRTILLGYGARTWAGSVASMFLARFSQLLMVPLSSSYDLGLYVVAITIADVPFILSTAVASALFGTQSKSTDASRLATVVRLSILGTAGMCLLLAVTVPFWLVPVFGTEYEGAIGPTALLLLSAVLGVPSLLLAAGLAAWGKPGLRGLTYGVGLVVNIGCFVSLVPSWGVYGACLAGIVTNLTMTIMLLALSKRTMKLPVRDFVITRRSDLELLGSTTAALTPKTFRRGAQ